MSFQRLLIVALLFFAIPNFCSATTWKITSLNWEPYAGKNLPDQGKSIQKLRHLLAKKGIDLIVEFYPWRRARIIAKTEGYVGYFPAWPEEIEDGFTASPRIDWSQIAIMKRKNAHITYKSLSDLFKKYSVGVIRTYSYPGIIEKAIHNSPGNVDRAPNESSLLLKLSHNRHPVAITDPKVMLYLAKEKNITNVETAEIIMTKQLVIALKKCKETQDRIKIINSLTQ